MSVVEKTVGIVFYIGITLAIGWLAFSFYGPIFQSDTSTLTWDQLFFQLIIATFFFIPLATVFGYAASVILSCLGLILGLFAEGIIALRNYYKRA